MPDPSARPRVVIIGGGFAGIAAARALRRVPVDVTLLDRTNHFIFQPLLYQVATAALAPSDMHGRFWWWEAKIDTNLCPSMSSSARVSQWGVTLAQSET